MDHEQIRKNNRAVTGMRVRLFRNGEYVATTYVKGQDQFWSLTAAPGTIAYMQDTYHVWDKQKRWVRISSNDPRTRSMQHGCSLYSLAAKAEGGEDSPQDGGSVWFTINGQAPFNDFWDSLRSHVADRPQDEGIVQFLRQSEDSRSGEVFIVSQADYSILENFKGFVHEGMSALVRG